MAESKSNSSGAGAPAKGPIICPGHTRPIPDLQYSEETEDGYFIVSSCLDGKPIIREGLTGDWIGTFEGHKGAVWCARFNKFATHVVTASADYSTKLWDAITGDVLHTFQDNRVVKSSVFSLCSKYIYTAGMEKKIRVYDLAVPTAEPTVLSGHMQTVCSLAVCNDPNLLVSCGYDECIKVWDLRTGRDEKTLVRCVACASVYL